MFKRNSIDHSFKNLELDDHFMSNLKIYLYIGRTISSSIIHY